MGRGFHHNDKVCALPANAARRSSRPVMCSLGWLLQLLTLLLFSVLASLNAAGGAGNDRSRSGLTLLARPLRCHYCYKSIHGEACVELDRTVTDIQRCREDEPYCMVQRYTVDGDLTTFSRACAKTCTTGCQSAGTAYKFENCYSCCQDNFCNIQSSAATRDTHSQFALLLPVVAVSLAIGRCMQ